MDNKCHLVRSGSGTYSCVALSEGAGDEARRTAGNATILITESVTYLDKVSTGLSAKIKCSKTYGRLQTCVCDFDLRKCMIMMRIYIKLYFQPHLNLLVVCVASFVLVFLGVFLLMVFLALRLKRKQQLRGQSRGQSQHSHVSQYFL